VSITVLLSLGILAFFMSWMIPARISAGLRANAIIIFGIMLTALFIFVAWGTVTKRLRIYAAITILALVFGYWFDLSPTWYFMILGAVIAIWGGTVLSRFVRTYPKMIDRNGRHFLRTYSDLQ
jgi:hypothetical protein